VCKIKKKFVILQANSMKPAYDGQMQGVFCQTFLSRLSHFTRALAAVGCGGCRDENAQP
jgi:hypothetical protein